MRYVSRILKSDITSSLQVKKVKQWIWVKGWKWALLREGKRPTETVSVQEPEIHALWWQDGSDQAHSGDRPSHRSWGSRLLSTVCWCSMVNIPFSTNGLWRWSIMYTFTHYSMLSPTVINPLICSQKLRGGGKWSVPSAAASEHNEQKQIKRNTHLSHFVSFC